MSNRCVVETYTFIDGWTNTWTEEDGTPMTFETEEKAQAELDFHLETLKGAVEKGYMIDAEENLRVRKLDETN